MKNQLLHKRQLTRCWNTHGAGHITLCGIFLLLHQLHFNYFTYTTLLDPLPFHYFTWTTLLKLSHCNCLTLIISPKIWTTLLTLLLLGEASLKKNGKKRDNVSFRVDPPPSDNWDIFEFETFLKNDDPPLLIDLRHFWNWD